MLMSNLLLRLNLEVLFKLDYIKFLDYDNFGNQERGIYFAKLVKYLELKYLVLALSCHILA